MVVGSVALVAIAPSPATIAIAYEGIKFGSTIAVGAATDSQVVIEPSITLPYNAVGQTYGVSFLIPYHILLIRILKRYSVGRCLL